MTTALKEGRSRRPAARGLPSRRARALAATWIVVASALAVLGVPRAEAQEGFKIIVNAANDVEEADRSLISKMFLKRVRRWDNGELVVPVDQDGKSEVRVAFSEAIHDKKVSAVISFWQRKIFAGRAEPPAQLESDRAVIEFVSREPGAIGYVSNGAELVDGIKVLTVVEDDD